MRLSAGLITCARILSTVFVFGIFFLEIPSESGHVQVCQKIRSNLKYVVKIRLLHEYFDFWRIFWFFNENFDFWRKFWFLTKILFFDENFYFNENFYFWRKFRFLNKIPPKFSTKIYIFHQHFDTLRKFWFLIKISIFCQFPFLTKILVFDRNYDFR